MIISLSINQSRAQSQISWFSCYNKCASTQFTTARKKLRLKIKGQDPTKANPDRHNGEAQMKHFQ